MTNVWTSDVFFWAMAILLLWKFRRRDKDETEKVCFSARSDVLMLTTDANWKENCFPDISFFSSFLKCQIRTYSTHSLQKIHSLLHYVIIALIACCQWISTYPLSHWISWKNGLYSENYSPIFVFFCLNLVSSVSFLRGCFSWT